MAVRRKQLAYLKYRMYWASRHLTRPAATWRLRRFLAGHSGPFRVQVGSGGVELAGWLNTDISPRCRYWLDVTRPWPFPAGSVEAVFADNVIEHLSLDAARTFLDNAHTALRPGGVLRVVTPDAGAVVQAYSHRSEAALAAMGRAGRQAAHPVDIIRSAFSLWGHHAGYVYDEEALVAELKRAGFRSVTRWANGASDDHELRGIDRVEPPYEFYLSVEGIR